MLNWHRSNLRKEIIIRGWSSDHFPSFVKVTRYTYTWSIEFLPCRKISFHGPLEVTSKISPIWDSTKNCVHILTFVNQRDGSSNQWEKTGMKLHRCMPESFGLWIQFHKLSIKMQVNKRSKEMLYLFIVITYWTTEANTFLISKRNQSFL